MGPTTLGRTWDMASSPSIARRAGRFEAAWKEHPDAPPSPRDYLPDDLAERSGALLAILRIDLAQRRHHGRKAALEWYRERFPDLGDEGLVALIYEEFCLREEDGTQPDPAEYELRFPKLASAIREVLDIHELVGSAGSSNLSFDSRSIEFPEAGQTIAGFRLVEELGRGTFARVYRAEDRTLADRPVALKVARPGSREPQTLARLQHTHIVPIYSHGTDPATGLHLLCMPYYGRVTLAALIADKALAFARTGRELVSAIERLQAPGDWGPPIRREELSKRSYPRALAWWGARLAEALQHAHDRGVLHRDIKPSNVLITGDGLPMLLDFNLAHEPKIEQAGPERLGGTLAYMAPEHLEAAAQGRGDGVDHRADLYALGVVLYESLGSRPFSHLTVGSSATESLLKAALHRKLGPPRIRDSFPDVPVELEAVLQKCLAPEPADRYDSASDLAQDLQAAADDAALRHAHEPVGSRLLRGVRRNRRRLAVGLPLAFFLLFVAALAIASHVDRQTTSMLAMHWVEQGEASARAGRHALASSQFQAALDLVRNRTGLTALRKNARRQRDIALRSADKSREIDGLFERAEVLKFGLLQFGGDPESSAKELNVILAGLGVLDNPNWASEPQLLLVDAERRQRLTSEINDLLFLAVTQRYQPNDPVSARRAVAVCDAALRFVESKEPWSELRDRFRQRDSSARFEHVDSSASPTARDCFQRGLIAKLDHDETRALAWFERAARSDPRDYWARFAYAIHLSIAGRIDEALAQYDVAVVLRPESPWAFYNRGNLLWTRRRAYEMARADLDRAISLTTRNSFLEARLDRAALLQMTGDLAGARADYQAVLSIASPSSIARNARVNLARLDADQGRTAVARTEYNRLVKERPNDSEARHGRALLALRCGEFDRADEDLTAILQTPLGPLNRSRVLGDRALARLANGRTAEALADAEAAYQLAPSPHHRGLWLRALLASGQDLDLRGEDPETIAGLPIGGTALISDLRAAADRARITSENGSGSLAASRNRALLLSALEDHPEALLEADRALTLSPSSAASFLLRARLRLRAEDRQGALRDVEQGLALEPGDPSLIALRGRIALETSDLRRAREDLSHTAILTDSAVRRDRATVFERTGQFRAAIDDWNEAIKLDAESASLFFARARTFGRLGQWENAFADLEETAARVDARSSLYPRIVALYAAGATEHPNRWRRVLGLIRRGLSEVQLERRS
jgi:eukaryotic-like serine/threonine-protein kinase